jgi:hypothetical protein
MIRKAPQIALALLVAALVAGCEVQYASVSGRVTLDGKPLKGATVGFYPPQGRGSHGVTDDDGRYELHYTHSKAGVPPGKCIVRITTADPNRPERLPAKYHEQSELSEEVKPSNNVFDFDLKSDK